MSTTPGIRTYWSTLTESGTEREFQNTVLQNWRHQQLRKRCVRPSGVSVVYNSDVLHAVTDAVFAGRNCVTIYDLDSDAPYSSFRLSITDNSGETTLMQLSEWRLLYYNEPIPQF